MSVGNLRLRPSPTRAVTVACAIVACTVAVGCTEPVPIPDVEIAELDACNVACRVRWTSRP